MYKGFLKAIYYSELRAYFIRTFRPKSLDATPPAAPIKKKKKKSKVRHTVTSPNGNTNKNVLTVKAKDFSFVSTITGPHLAYGAHISLCFVRREWFQRRVLKAIDRTFKIRLSDYVGFTFIPQSDRQVFLNLLEQTNFEVEKQIYEEQLAACHSKVERFINSCVENNIRNCQKIKFDTNLGQYRFNEDKQVYIYQFNALEYLGLTQNGMRIHISLSWILEKLDEANLSKFQEEITSKYPEGYVTFAEIDKIFPNHISFDITIVIPKLFIDRFGKDKSIGIKADYSSTLGYFKGGVTACIPGYNYQTAPKGVIFSDEIKTSLINIMRNIDSKFLITFYSAFIYMFNEGDAIVQSKYEKILEQLKSPKKRSIFHLYLGRRSSLSFRLFATINL